MKQIETAPDMAYIPAYYYYYYSSSFKKPNEFQALMSEMFDVHNDVSRD